MKKTIVLTAAIALVAGTLSTGIALAGMSLTGEITKISGEFVTVKTDKGERRIHVDPVATKKTGDLKVGAQVEADVTSMGHANWITVIEEEKE